MPLKATLLNASAFVAMQADRPPLIVDPWLAAGSVTLLFGPPSAGKTHLTLSMARAIAHGEKLWDMYETQKSRVLIVQADMNTALYQERVRPHIAKLGDDVLVLATDGMPFDITALQPSDPIVQAVREFSPGIIFVDTLRKSHMLDENDSNAADKVYTAWRSLFPGAAFVFLHHSRKLPTTPDANKMLAEAFRGSGAWAASADTIILQRRVRKKGNADWLTRVGFIRTRSCAEPSPVLLKLMEDLTLTTLAETPSERALLQWLTLNPRGGRNEAVKWLTSQTDEAGTVLCSQATAYRVWDRVVKGGYFP